MRHTVCLIQTGILLSELCFLQLFLKLSQEDAVRIGYLRSICIIGVIANSLILIVRMGLQNLELRPMSGTQGRILSESAKVSYGEMKWAVQAF